MLKGAAGDLDDAIAVHHEAIGVGTAKGVESRHMATLFEGLATELLMRYRAGDDLKDLDAAVAAGGQAVARAPEPEPGMLHNLCSMLTHRTYRTRSATDLSEALRFGQEAVDAAPVGHPERPAALNDLSIAWQFRDLDKAIVLAREAVALSPDRGVRDVRKATALSGLPSSGGLPQDGRHTAGR
ncbi:hypothetical protein [Streptomyces sp. NPDC002763]|uniref:hypothetical protein n=1 Tax=Streptomyces sp. NPDC002763 TaxID=3154427 RepID=UPI00331E5C03